MRFYVFPSWQFSLVYKIIDLNVQTIITDNLETALRVTNELLELQPDHERASFNKMYYEDELRNPTTQQSEENVDGDGGTAAQATVSAIENMKWFFFL